MSRTLAAVQRDFAAMLLAEASPGGRPGIYHHNRRAHFCKALALGYPVIERIVGSEFFAQLALDYLRSHPSRSGDLHDAGRQFPAFLAAGFATDGSQFEYLADLARLEWAWQNALIAADMAPQGVQRLTDFAPQRWPRLRFTLQPALTLIASRWPIHTLFVEHRRPAPATVRLDIGGECVGVLRSVRGVEAHRLSAAEHALWVALADGRPLEAAVAGVPSDETARPRFDLGLALQRLFELGVVIAVEASAADV